MISRMTRGLIGFGGVLAFGFGSLAAESPERSEPSADERCAITESAVRTIGFAAESYFVDHGGYPVTSDIERAVRELKRYFPPGKEPKTVDGWLEPLRFTSDGRTYRIWSSRPGEKGDPEVGVVFENGAFLRMCFEINGP